MSHVPCPMSHLISFHPISCFGTRLAPPPAARRPHPPHVASPRRPPPAPCCVAPTPNTLSWWVHLPAAVASKRTSLLKGSRDPDHRLISSCSFCRRHGAVMPMGHYRGHIVHCLSLLYRSHCVLGHTLSLWCSVGMQSFLLVWIAWHSWPPPAPHLLVWHGDESVCA